METFDVVVIGGGPGGYPAAIRAAQLGASVALVEKERMGGTCLNWGCIPTKTLIAASDLYARIGGAESMGITCPDVSFDFAAMRRRKDEVVGTLRTGVEQLLQGNGVKVFKGTGSVAARDRIVVGEGKDEEILAAGRTIIATGSTSAVPGFIPHSARVLESRAFLDIKALPGTLIVLGGGVIGCEFACLAAQLGVEVTVVEMLDDILVMLDSDIRRELRRHMENALGIRVLTGEPMQSIAADKQAVTGSVGKEQLQAEKLLVSVGRRPVTRGLQLKKAGLATDDAGFIEIDASCRTAAATIYAVGDVTAGTTQLAHAATAQGIAAAENACGRRPRPAEALVPACIFTAPEIGSVGLSEQEAKQLGREVRVGKFIFAASGKALAMGEPHGFVKLLADAGTDQLLGAHAVGPHATELVSEATAALRAELTATELGRTIHAHPTLSEAWMEAAHAIHNECIHQPPRRRK